MPGHTPMPNTVDRVEVFSGIQRRRRYSLDQKLAVLSEAAQPGMSISFIARKHGISPSLLFGWRRRMTEGGKEAVRVDDEVVASAQVRALEKRIRELERVLGKKTLENEILREALKVAQEKKLISHLPSLPEEDTP
jgi:transposase